MTHPSSMVGDSNPSTGVLVFEEQGALFEPEPERLPDWERALRMFDALGLGDTSDELHVVTIPGAPWSKSRPRFGRGGRVYAKPEDVDAETRTGLFLRRRVPSPFTGNVAIGCIFFRPNRQRIDADNMLKHVCDAANGILWADDSQCTAIMGLIELDAAAPRTVIVIGAHRSTMRRGTDAIYPCAVCDKPIAMDGQNGKLRKTCSPECTQKRKGYVSLADFAKCEHCGQEFRKESSYRRLCSPECRVASLRGKRKAAAQPLSRCATCDKELAHRRGGQCRDCWRATRPGQPTGATVTITQGVAS